MSVKPMRIVCCTDCKSKVINDEIAINIKILGKQIGSVRCYDCLSKALSCESIKLKELAEYYKVTGCTVFQTKYI